MTEAQLRLVERALGDGSDWPKATIDPQVNHRVDQLVMDGEIPDWSNLSASERETYIEEAHLNSTLEL